MPTPKPHPALRIIAAYKLAKAIALLLVAVTAFGLVDAARFDAFARWILELPIQHGHALLVRLFEHLSAAGPHRFEAIGAAACVYACVFLVEGWGLWRERRWAEYLTTIVTASLIPFELWEIGRHPAVLEFVALAVNIAIVIYLVHLLRRPRTSSRR